MSSDLIQLATLIAAIVLLAMRQRDASKKETSDAAAQVQRDEVKAVVTEVKKTADATHNLVNGGQLPSLRTIADQARVISTQAQVIADVTGQTGNVASTAATAIAAEANLADHIAKVGADALPVTPPAAGK
jgi:bifunctional ADP-heptose synthase (sugar kinase/adenylyltransferase)